MHRARAFDAVETPVAAPVQVRSIVAESFGDPATRTAGAYLVRERHAALARDAEHASPAPHAHGVSDHRAGGGPSALPRLLVLRLAGRRP